MNNAQIRTLFITKQSEIESQQYHGYFRQFSGLFNSARLVSEMLNDQPGIDSKCITVQDNNGIDREVTLYKPTHVFIEAFWVVPEKFKILKKLHPGVKWIIRIHSETPFLSTEGISMDWAMKYITQKNVYLAPNAPRIYNEIKHLVASVHGHELKKKVIYLPNFYSVDNAMPAKTKLGTPGEIHIACFGAIRQLKNQLIQAISAIKFADKHRLKLKFHINGNRVDYGGNPILKNIVDLFSHHPEHELIQHDWMPHEEFLALIKTLDIGMQVSFTETFNIVTADMVICGIPVVVSDEVQWSSIFSKVNPTDSDNITATMEFVWNWHPFVHWRNTKGLKKYSDTSRILWTDYLYNN